MNLHASFPVGNLPVAPLSLLHDFLSKRCSSDSFRESLSTCPLITAPEDTTSHVIGFTTRLDQDHEAMHSGGRYERLVSRSLYFTILPFETGKFFSLAWSQGFSGQSWRLQISEEANVEMLCKFWVPVPWLESLARLAVVPVLPLARCLSLVKDERAVGIEDEIIKRATCFAAKSNALYFQNVRLFLNWEVAFRWPKWEQDSIAENDRLAELNQAWSIDVDLEEFRQLSPRNFLRTEKPLVGFFHDCPHYPSTRRSILDKTLREATVFSRGGDWRDFLYRANASVANTMPNKSSLKSESEIESALWWWRSISEWPLLMQEEFNDNWSESAFLYELRARLSKTRTWDFFQCSWFHLDVSQRAVLYYFWPPRYPRGKHWRQGQIFGDNKASHEFHNIKPDKNPAAFSKQEKMAWDSRFQTWHHDLLGLPPDKRRRPGSKKTTAWDLLEVLDLDYYLPDKNKLTNTEHQRKRRAEEFLEKACKEAGLPSLAIH